MSTELTEHDLSELQEQIEWRRNDLQRSILTPHDGEHIDIVAVRINSDKLRIGELTIIDPETRFDQFAQQTYVSRYSEWKLQIDVPGYEFDFIADLCLKQLKVSIGRDVHRQPCSGTGWARIRPYLASPNWSVDIQGIGELQGRLDATE